MKNQRAITLVLPFKLPTWNRLLAMNHWERKKVRHWLHDFVCAALQGVNDSETLTDVVLRPSLTDLQRLEYGRMITPRASLKYRLGKKSMTRTRQSLRFSRRRGR